MNDVLLDIPFIIIALVAGFLLLMPVKVLLKEGLKKNRIGTALLLIWAMGYGMNPYKQPPWLLFQH
jgi:hypothetical protein